MVKDIVDPQMIKRLDEGLFAVENFQITNSYQGKPYAELQKQRLAIKYLDFIEKRGKFDYINRYK